jgi:uncharacterized membrane protein
MSRLLKVAALALTFAYPFVVWGGLTWLGKHLDERQTLLALAGALAVIFALRLIVGALAPAGAKPLARAGTALAVAGVALAALSVLLREGGLLLWYPVAVNTVFLALFGGSLVRPPPLVERLARLRTPDLPPPAVRYTRRVTQVWCIFFVVNGSIAAGTCLYGDLQIWTLYNGLLSYVLIGLLAGAEFLVRRSVVSKTSTGTEQQGTG